jgi:hypothetical protein
LEIPVATRTCNSCIQGELIEKFGLLNISLILSPRTLRGELRHLHQLS